MAVAGGPRSTGCPGWGGEHVSHPASGRLVAAGLAGPAALALAGGPVAGGCGGCAGVLAVSLAGAIFFREKIGWRRLGAIAVGFIGVLLIVKPGADGFNIYSMYALATVLVVTVRDLAARRLDATVPSLTVAWVGAVGVTIVSGLASLTETWVMPSTMGMAQIAGAVIFIIGAYTLSVMTMRVGDIASVSPFRYTGLLWAMLMGWFVFGDWPDNLTLLGSAIVAATGIITLMRERRLGKRATPPGPRIR